MTRRTATALVVAASMLAVIGSAAQTMADPLWPRGHQYWKSSFLRGLPDDAIDVVVEHFASIPSPMTPVLVDHNGGGAIARVPAEETAFGHRGWTFNLLISSIWSDAADTASNVAWTRRFMSAMQPHSADALYVNYLGAEGDERPADVFGASYERLVAVKDAYDPGNVFRLYHNIRPSAG